MNVSTTIPATIEIRRSRLLWLVTGVGILVAVVTWALVSVAFDRGSSSAQPVSTYAANPSSAAQDARSVPSILTFTPARLAAGALGTGYAVPTARKEPTVASVLASMSPSTRRYTQAVMALTFRQLSAGAAGSP